MCQERSRRRSTSPRKKTALSGIHAHQSLSTLPPNEPTRPRAILHATCGPVHASEDHARAVVDLAERDLPRAPRPDLHRPRRVACRTSRPSAGGADSASSHARPSGRRGSVRDAAATSAAPRPVAGANGSSTASRGRVDGRGGGRGSAAPAAGASSSASAAAHAQRLTARNDQSLLPTKFSGVTSTIAIACARISPTPTLTSRCRTTRLATSESVETTRNRSPWAPTWPARPGTSSGGSTCSCSRPRRGTTRRRRGCSAGRPTSRSTCRRRG